MRKRLNNLPLEQLKKEGNKLGTQLNEWNDVFDLLRVIRKNKLSELEAFSIFLP